MDPAFERLGNVWPGVERLRSVWRRTFSLGWPIATQQFLNTLMRTVDLVVTGLFSPAAVAAVGLADLYAGIPRRAASSLGTGAIALSSQDTGRGAAGSRDEAITQAMGIGLLVGIPMLLAGLLFARPAIAVLGAAPAVVRLGGSYLTIIFAASPLRIVGYVGARALQGTGDTRTPMFVFGASSLFNIIGTVGVGLGVGPLPRLGIVGVGLATAASRVFEAVAIVALLLSDRTEPGFVRPSSPLVTRQLVAISLPRFGELLSSGIARFPFNAILLTFGTETNAAYHIGRRLYQQLAGPLYRTYGTAASIIVGQDLGEGRPDDAMHAVFAIIVAGVGTVGAVALGLFYGGPGLVAMFSDDPVTVRYGVDFVRVFAVASVFMVARFVFAGGLQSAGDTRTPLYAQFSGQVVFLIGFSYVVGIRLGVGLEGVFLGLLLSYVWSATVVAAGFVRGEWAGLASSLIAEREESFE